MTALRVTHSSADVLVSGNPNLRSTYTSADVLVSGTPNLRSTQVTVDVILTVADGAPNFPDSPTVGQIYSFTRYNSIEVRQWQWDGVSWRTVGQA